MAAKGADLTGADYRSLLASMSDLVFVMDDEGRFIFTNGGEPSVTGHR